MNKKYKIIYKLQFFYLFGSLFSQQEVSSAQEPITNEVVVERHYNGVKKIVNVYRGKGVNEVMIAKYGFFDSGIKNFVSNYKDNKQNGLYTRWNANGIKVEECTYKNNNMDGSFSSWFDNGNIDKKYNYKDGKIDGSQEWYYENGNKAESSEYTLGMRNGNYVRWFYDGQKEYSNNYKDDKMDGLQEWYYKNGVKSRSSEYSLGVKNGNFKEWYENGQLKFNFNYKNNKKDGLQEEWSNNGKLITSGNYKDGEMHGLQEYYRFGDENGEPNGMKSQSLEYSFGELNGQFKEWFWNGKLKYKGNYKDKKYDGIYESYYDNGGKQFIKEYSLGTLNGEYSEFSNDGKLITKGVYEEGLMQGKWYFYFKNKNNIELFAEPFYKNGNGGDPNDNGIPFNGMTGKVVTYFATGEKYAESYFNNGIREGDLTRYYKDGSIKMEVKFIKGKANGDMISYHKNGNISTFHQLKDGELAGLYYEKDSTGETIVSESYYVSGQQKPIAYFHDDDNFSNTLPWVSGDEYQAPIKVDFSNPSNRLYKMWNDRITSISIEEGYQVKVFEDGNFKGRYAIFTSADDLSHLKKFRMNDEISSFIIDVYIPESLVAIFYSDGDFQGKYFRYGVGQVKNMKKETNFNDDISSIRIKEGYRVKIYQNDSFNGRSTELIESASELKSLNMNDDMSSFIIERL